MLREPAPQGADLVAALTDGDPHAGHTEHVADARRRPTWSGSKRTEPGPIPATIDLVRSPQAAEPEGVLGDPTAQAEHGVELFSQLADDLADAIDEWVGVKPMTERRYRLDPTVERHGDAGSVGRR